MCESSIKWDPWGLVLGLLMFMAGQVSAVADESQALQIHVDKKVIYCSAKLNIDVDQFRLPMQDGIAVATEWYLKIGKVRDYWLNETIGEISVIRRVEPDLLSHSWLLIDVSSGISHRVFQINNAIDFLMRLHRFPVLDRSLLVAGIDYRALVKIEIHVGDANHAWWAGLWPSTVDSMQAGFKLP